MALLYPHYIPILHPGNPRMLTGEICEAARFVPFDPIASSMAAQCQANSIGTKWRHV